MLRSLLILFTLVALLVGGSALSATMASPPTIELSKAVHFLTPNGEDVMVGAGTYEVEAVKEGLKLTPKGGKESDAVIVQALPMPHGESLTAPKAQSEPGPGPDEHRIALLRPDSTGGEKGERSHYDFSRRGVGNWRQ